MCGINIVDIWFIFYQLGSIEITIKFIFNPILSTFKNSFLIQFSYKFKFYLADQDIYNFHDPLMSNIPIFGT